MMEHENLSENDDNDEENAQHNADRSGSISSDNGEDLADKASGSESSHHTSGAGKVLLTSRRHTKHVTIQENSSCRPRGFHDVDDAVNKLESSFQNGIEDIRRSMAVLESDRKSLLNHVKSLEESLIKSNQEKETYRVGAHQLNDEAQKLREEIQACRKDNTELSTEKENIQSDYQSHLRSIAKQYRQKGLARRTVSKWKGKLKKQESDKINNLVEENRKLKQELLAYQEAAKHAFLRSANTLNSEALTLFQNVASRCLGSEASDVGSPERASNSTSSQSSSDHDSSSILSRGSENPNKENVNRQNQNQSAYRQQSASSHAFLNRNKYHRTVEEGLAHGSNKGRKRTDDANNGNHLKKSYFQRFAKPDTNISDFLPNPLRQETRQIMQQLQTSRNKYGSGSNLNSTNNSGNKCQSQTHVHICHCTPLPGRPGNCPYCTPNQNFNFANMPIAAESIPNYAMKRKPPNAKSKSGEGKVRNVVLASVGSRSKDNTKVIYKPSGSTVVVEKHLKS